MALTTSPPRVITLDEYERVWKKEGWQLLMIGPTANWRQEWSDWESIRDLVQNCLDEAESYRWGYDEQGLWISDRGHGIAIANFLLGPPRLKPDWARGKFGEGMKIAALVFLREGYSVHIETAGKEIWMIFLEQDIGEGRVETLAALWRPDEIRTGTKFNIIGYFGDAFADRFTVNLPRKRILAEGPSLLTQPVRRFNQLIQAPEGQPSRIYVRDIFMAETDGPFSCNLWSLELSPDRFAPKKEGDMWNDIGRLWCCVTREDLLETFLKMVSVPPQIPCSESSNLSLGRYNLGTEPVTGKYYTEFIRENASAWRAAWKKVFGDGTVIRTDDRRDATVKHLGYEPVGLSWHVRDTLEEVISSDASLIKASQERLREAQVIPDKELNYQELASLKLARAVAKSVARYNPVAGVYAAIIPAASDRVRTAGMYSRLTQEIYISLETLGHAQTTIDTVIHEIAHHTSGAEDLEERHASAMTSVAAEVVRAASEGDFDELMKEATW